MQKLCASRGLSRLIFRRQGEVGEGGGGGGGFGFRGDGQAEQQGVGEGEGVGGVFFPGVAVRAEGGGEKIAGALETEPGAGEVDGELRRAGFMRGIDRGAVAAGFGAILEFVGAGIFVARAIVGEDKKENVATAGGEIFAGHQSGASVEMCGREAGDADDDVEIAGLLLVGEMELVGVVPDVAAAGGDGEAVGCGSSDAVQGWIADVGGLARGEGENLWGLSGLGVGGGDE